MRTMTFPLVLALSIATPAFCQKEAETDSHQERELKACGPKDKEVMYVADTDKKSHPQGTSTADTSLIYIIRSTMYGNKIQTKVAVDGEWKGVNRGNNYFFFALKPGTHYFCSKSENNSIAILTTDAGKTYYLAQTIHMGLMKARNDLIVIEDAEGAAELAKAHPSTWEVK